MTYPYVKCLRLSSRSMNGSPARTPSLNDAQMDRSRAMNAGQYASSAGTEAAEVAGTYSKRSPELPATRFPSVQRNGGTRERRICFAVAIGWASINSIDDTLVCAHYRAAAEGSRRLH